MFRCLLVLLAACGSSPNAAPAVPAPSVPSVVVTVDGKSVPMRAVYAVLLDHGNVEVVLSSEPRTCADGADFDSRPGEIGFSYELGQHALQDGSTAWARRGYFFEDTTSHAVSSIGDDMPNAIVENRPGGRVKFRLADDDGKPLELSETMSATGSIATTLCPAAAPPAAASGTGFVEVAGHRYSTSLALLAASLDDPKYKQLMWLEVAMLPWSATATCADLAGTEAHLKIYLTKQGKPLRVSLDGERFASSGGVGDPKSITVKPAVLELRDGSVVEIAGTTNVYPDGYLDNQTGEFANGGDEKPYRVTVSGKFRVLDCGKR